MSQGAVHNIKNTGDNHTENLAENHLEKNKSKCAVLLSHMLNVPVQQRLTIEIESTLRYIYSILSLSLCYFFK